MFSQIDIRYSVSDSVQSVREKVNAFPGNMTFCAETNILYVYKEFGNDAEMPTDDGILVLHLVDSSISGAWLAISLYTNKLIKGVFTVEDWVPTNDNEHYNITVNIPNIKGYHISFLDADKKAILVEDVQEIIRPQGEGIDLVFSVGAIPDCRFAGSYTITYSGL